MQGDGENAPQEVSANQVHRIERSSRPLDDPATFDDVKDPGVVEGEPKAVA